MRIGEFNFAVMAGAGGDEKIIRRRAPSCFAATVGQLASALPDSSLIDNSRMRCS
jgi:hypothetical protein